MKKLFLIISATLVTEFVSGQVNLTTNPNINSIQNGSPFIDASSFYDPQVSGNNNGKGLVFPQVSLETFEFNVTQPDGFSVLPTMYDGMIVYNKSDNVKTRIDGNRSTTAIDLKPGFYYFSNPTGKQVYENTGSVLEAIKVGQWVRLGSAGDTNNIWSLSGNLGTKAADLDKKTNLITDGNWIGTKDEKSLTIGTNNFARIVIGSEPIEEAVGPTQSKYKFVMKVYGKARFSEGIFTSNSTYPDYVFDHYFTGSSKINPKYKFRTLAETEQFIKENNHLPGVTKIDELQKDGDAYMIDPTKLSVQSLEKVEELYLHTIQQQKEINTLKAELAEIKAMIKK